MPGGFVHWSCGSFQNDRWVLFSADLSIITSGDDVFIFYLPLLQWGYYSRHRQEGATRARCLSSLPDSLKTSWTYPKEVILNDAQSWERGSES